MGLDAETAAGRGIVGWAGRTARWRCVRLLIAVAACFIGTAARAERADQNAVTSAEDAFGTSEGSQNIGLYSMNSARGFSPQQAGNLRIEGLYFFQPGDYVNHCLASSTTIRVGIAAQSFSFPSPTGIADIKLLAPADTPRMSAVASGGSYQEAGALIEGHAPISDHVRAAGCVSVSRNFLADFALDTSNVATASVLRWRPTDETEVRVFGSYVIGSGHRILPTVYTDGALPPPLFDLRRLATQPFTSQGWRTTTLGVLLRQSFGAQWSLTGGLFRSIDRATRSFIEEYVSVLPDRSADHDLDLAPEQTSTATSGEIRLARRFGSNAHPRTLEFAVRGRQVDREYGGDAITDYGPVTLESGPPTAVPRFATSAVSRDETRQLDVGVVYEERWAGVGTLSAGLLKTHYRRALIDPGAAPDAGSAAPSLANLRFTITPRPALTVYGSFVQGLEDSARAPSTAANRGQPPPATRTRQVDAGIRYAPGGKLTLILGAFDIDKVYFNQDAANVYSALGTIRHRGLESSISYSTRGVTLVAGGVLLRPHIERTVAEPGATGFVPLGAVPLLVDVNLDWAPPGWRPWAASLQWKRWSPRVATSDNRYWLPPLSTLNAGLRFESSARRYPFSVRFDALNVTDAEGLHLSSVGLVTPERGRRFTFTFAIDI